jgi:glycosyltransferase involved in cell wall biosynthesis
MLSTQKSLTIGIPLKNEEGNIPKLIEVIEKLILDLEDEGVVADVIVNENCSSDGSLELLTAWAQKNPQIKIRQIDFPIPFQHSILEMMKDASGDAFVVFQSDLQDPSDLIVEFVRRWKLGSSIVAGVVIARNEIWFDRSLRRFFYSLLQKFSDGNIIPGFQDFYLVSKPVYKKLSKLPSSGAFIRGHISSRFGVIETVRYTRNPRIFGKSKFDFASKYGLAMDGILLFGTKFVRLISVLSFITFLLAGFGVLLLLALYLAGIRYSAHGWASLTSVLLVILSLFGLFSSLVLEYLIRIYRAFIFRNE